MKAVMFIRLHLVVFVCALCKRAHSAASADVSLRGAVAKVNSTKANEWATNSSVELADATIGAGKDRVPTAAQRWLLGKTDSDLRAQFTFNTDVQSGTSAHGEHALRSKSSASELKSVGVNYFVTKPADANIAFIQGGKGFVFKYRASASNLQCGDHSFSEDFFTLRLPPFWYFSASLSGKILHVHSKGFVDKDGWGHCEVTITTDVMPYIQTVTLSEKSHWEVHLDCTGDSDCSIETRNMKHTTFGIYGQSAVVKASI